MRPGHGLLVITVRATQRSMSQKFQAWVRVVDWPWEPGFVHTERSQTSVYAVHTTRTLTDMRLLDIAINWFVEAYLLRNYVSYYVADNRIWLWISSCISWRLYRASLELLHWPMCSRCIRRILKCNKKIHTELFPLKTTTGFDSRGHSNFKVNYS